MPQLARDFSVTRGTATPKRFAMTLGALVSVAKPNEAFPQPKKEVSDHANDSHRDSANGQQRRKIHPQDVVKLQFQESLIRVGVPQRREIMRF